MRILAMKVTLVTLNQMFKQKLKVKYMVNQLPDSTILSQSNKIYDEKFCI